MGEALADMKSAFDQWRFKLAVPADTASAANRTRSGLLEALISEGAAQSAGNSKIFLGSLSPGCQSCIKGVMSCRFINRLCTASCFFCPQDRSRKAEKQPEAEGITFEDPDRYVDYLQRFGFEGVGFSGGEPLMVMDRLLLFLRRIKWQFGCSIYTWLYTNGDLVDEDKLKMLRDAGVDEIRFNLAARAP